MLSTRCFALLLALPIVAHADDSSRTITVVIDGKEVQVTVGQEVEVPCGHEKGETHKVKVVLDGLATFEKLGVSFTHSSELTAQVEEEMGYSMVAIDHASSFFAQVQVHKTKIDAEALEDTFLPAMLDTYKSSGMEVTVEKDAEVNLAGAPRPCKVIKLKVGPQETHCWVTSVVGKEMSYVVVWSWSDDEEAAAKALWEPVRDSLKLE